MKLDNYKNHSEAFSQAIDIAISVLQKYPPKGWDEKAVSEVVAFNLEIKENVLNPEPQFRNLKSLKFSIEIVFTKFQEGHGIHVEEFWKEIKAQNLPYKRENKMLKILKRKKINNIHEYDFVIDVIVPYQQEGLINEEEVVLLNDLIAQFEMRKKK